jgi:hypothetical protein
MSRISIDQDSLNHLIMRYISNTNKPFDNLFISFVDDKIRIDINNINYDSLSFITRNTLSLVIGSNISILIDLKIINNELFIRTDILGVVPSVIQNIPGITSLILLFIPELENIEGLSFESTFDMIYNLETILIKDNKLTEIIKFESIETKNNLTLNFSSKE